MGFNPSAEEKKQRADIGEIGGKQQAAADTAGKRGGKAFKFFNQSAKPALDYWRNILGGDRTAISEFLGPELESVSSTYDSLGDQLTDFTPRGGGRASGQIELANRQASDTSNIVQSARPRAAGALGDLAGMFGGVAGQQGGLELGGLGQAGQTGLQLNELAARDRQAKMQFWGSLAGAAGGLAGDLFFGKLGS